MTGRRERQVNADPALLELRQLTIYLLRRGTDGPDGALDAETQGMVTRRELRGGLPFTGALYFRAQQNKPPVWQAFLNDGLTNEDALKLSNRNAAAVLVIRVARHWFALPFGFGRHLVRDEAIELGFGLRATLNSVDADRLRSVDMRTIDEMTLQTRRQASRISGLEVFGINITKDILGGVTGQPRDPALAQVMTGRDACVIQGPVTFEGIGEKCRELLAAYSRKDYEERFGWIDHLSTVDDDALVSTLDEQVVAAFAANNFAALHLATPEQVDWEQVAGFRYSVERDDAPLRSDPDALEYLEARANRPRARGEIDVAALRHDKLEVFGGPADTRLAAWSIYRSCVFQTNFANKIYALSGGQWYEVEPTFAADIAAQVNSIAELAAGDVGLPAAQPGETEPEYLERATPAMTEVLGAPVALMDRKLVRAADAATDIEVCDLFTSLKHFIHVKRRTRSSTLSHLFAQGIGSAGAFVTDRRFRELARAAIAESGCGTEEFFPNEQPTARDYTVVYAIVAAGDDPIAMQLPFLSQVTMSQAARQLRGWGYEVAIMRIPQL